MNIETFLTQNPLPTVPSRPVRVGVIGLGFIAESCHLPALRFLQQRGWPVNVTGLCDIREERQRLFQSMFSGSQLFSSSEALLKSGCADAVILLTPPAITPGLIETGIQQKIAVFSEKPVSHDAHRLQAMHTAAGKAGVPIQVGYNRRYQPLADPFLQSVRQLNGFYAVEARLWRAGRGEPEFYTDTMIHAVDFLEYAFGPLQVGQTVWAPAIAGEKLRRSVRVELSNGAGLRCGLDVRPATGRNVESYEAFGTGQSVVLKYPPQGKGEPALLASFAAGDISTGFAQNAAESEEMLLCLRGFIHQLAAFLRLATGENDPSRCTLNDARRTCELCDRIVSQLHS